MKTLSEHAAKEVATGGSEASVPLPFMHPAVLFPRVVLLATLLDLFGWVCQLKILTSLVPGFSTMKPNTAAALALLAIYCRAKARKGEPKTSPDRVSQVALCIAIALGCGTLLEYASGRAFGIDGLLIRVASDSFGDPPGRMGAGTALCITITGCALAFLNKAPKLAHAALIIANVLTVAALAGFVVNDGPLLNNMWFRSMSVPTALCLLMLALASLAVPANLKTFLTLFPETNNSGEGWWLSINAMILISLGAVPSVVAMRVGLTEAAGTFLCLALSFYSAQTLFYQLSVTHPLEDSKVDAPR